MKQFLLIIALASALFTGCWPIDSSEFVLTSPQFVTATTEPKIKIDSFFMNGKKWPIQAEKTTISLRSPRKNLAGISLITLGSGYKNNEKDANFGVGLSLPENNDENQILVSLFGLGIDDLSEKSLSAEEGYSINFRVECGAHGESYKNEVDDLKIKLIPRGEVIFEQKKKHITIKGTFDIPSTPIPRDPYMICDVLKSDEKGVILETTPLYRNPAPPAVVEIRGLHIDIDTDLTFRWCSKSGECYER